MHEGATRRCIDARLGLQGGADVGAVRARSRLGHAQEQRAAFFKQKTAYEILRSDWSSDVCSSD
eukprot:COSAG01_NODE_60961_length_292_cov_0.269430_1_plen_63_part_01